MATRPSRSLGHYGPERDLVLVFNGVGCFSQLASIYDPKEVWAAISSI